MMYLGGVTLGYFNLYPVGFKPKAEDAGSGGETVPAAEKGLHGDAGQVAGLAGSPPPATRAASCGRSPSAVGWMLSGSSAGHQSPAAQ